MVLSEFLSEKTYFSHCLYDSAFVLPIARDICSGDLLVQAQFCYSVNAIKSIPRFWGHHVALSKEQRSRG